MKFLKMVAILFAVLVCTLVADAGDRRSRRNATCAECAVAVAKVSSEPVSEVSNKPVAITETAETTSKSGSNDALDEVNAYRAKRGLAPFQRDPQLTEAALKAAKQRASRGIHGHLPESDFTCLPPGATADAAGCGALEDSWGWGTCCSDENYSHAGAAWVRGADGRRYMHLFVRNSPPASVSKQTVIDQPIATGETISASGTCSSGACSSGGFSAPLRFSGRRR